MMLVKIPKSAELILNMAKDLTKPIIYIGAAAMIISLIKYIFAWKNHNAEVQADATTNFVGAAMVVGIRLWLPTLFEETAFYHTVLKMFS